MISLVRGGRHRPRRALRSLPEEGISTGVTCGAARRRPAGADP